jgi:hypothetical protein
MHDHSAQASLAGATALIILAAAVIAGLAAGLVTKRWRSALIATAVTGGVFQLAHFAEHLAQSGYWTAHRDQAPWMTPWAQALADSFGGLAPGTPSFGMEALHLAGNAIFLAGAVAILVVVTRYGPVAARRPARLGVVVQAVHVAEHVGLTVSVLVAGRAYGLSTLLGSLDPGPGLWSYRILWHLTINATATALLAAALIRCARHGAPSATPRSHHPALAG